MQLEDYSKKRINNLLIQGHSRAAERTCFYIHELKIMFDAGISTYLVPKFLMLTHTHTDHSYNLPKTMYPINIKNLHERKIFTPYQSVPPLRKFIDSIQMMENCKTYSRWSHRYNIVGAQCNQVYELHHNYIMETFECYHGIPCLGYGILDRKKKLKKEYLGQDINKLKKQEDYDESKLFDDIIKPIICYLGDTRIEVFNNSSKLKEYPIIFIECTYLEEDMLQNAKENNHINWIELKPWIELYKDTKFILIHFSLRYKDSYIKDFFDKEIESLNNKNIYVWLDTGVVCYNDN